MEKIFFMCTHCNQGTGYGRGACKIVNHLCKSYEVVYYAFQNYPNQAITDRFIDPRITFIDALTLDSDSPGGFGDRGIVPSFDQEKPDILFLYNDINVCRDVLRLLEAARHKDYRVVLYLDIVYPWENFMTLEYLRSRASRMFVYLSCWKEHLEKDLGIECEVLEHGLDHEKFHEVPDAKRQLGFDDDDFIVLNLNRNSIRKKNYIGLQAFFHLLDMNDWDPRLKMFLSCVLENEDGYRVHDILDTECKKRGRDIEEFKNTRVFINPLPMMSSDAYINLLCNACDVGINTTGGEGFGLTNVEHALLNKPQVVSGVPAMKETLGGVALVVEPKLWIYPNNGESHGGHVALLDPLDVAEALQRVFKGEHTGAGYRAHFDERFRWEKSLQVLTDL